MTPGTAGLAAAPAVGDRPAPEQVDLLTAAPAVETRADAGAPVGVTTPPVPATVAATAATPATPGPAPADPPVAAQLTPQLLALASDGGRTR
ncbi:hypothetical protein ACFQX8_28035 [Klenkia terrae]|uniref:hypothetical protein n=1 Tax=Klenkia terrae TaxID=1052259 RepID=UPI00361AFAA3